MDKIAQQLIDKSSEAIKQASHMIGQTAGHVYLILVRQQLIDGIAGILAWALYLVTVSILTKKLFAMCNKSYKKSGDGIEWFTFVIVECLILILGYIVFSQIQQNIEQILNPEYFAIKFIFDSVGNH